MRAYLAAMTAMVGTDRTVVAKIASRLSTTARSYRVAMTKMFCAAGSAASTVTASSGSPSMPSANRPTV